MPVWLRNLGFICSLPFALALLVLSMAITAVSSFLMLVALLFSCCTSSCGPYEKWREVLKTLSKIHFYLIGWCTCDKLWFASTTLALIGILDKDASDQVLLQNDQNYQHHYPGPGHVIRIPPPPQLITDTICSSNSPSSQSLGSSLCKRSFTYEELMLSTDNFSRVNLLGEGGFSYVYKGIFNGTEVAIKHFKDTQRQTDLEFIKEADILSHVHHRNLVSLIGFCISDGKRLLVCEYVANKTLDFHLYGRNRSTLAWIDRYRIAMDCAKGLAYLHEDCQPRVIHRDIKAANILLDYSFRAKIADFGISKHFADENTHVSTVVKGTPGYLAPEYASTGQLTDKSDVFSYGVLLLGLITGRKHIGLVDWARPLLQRALENDTYDALIDPFLENNYDPIEVGIMVACASACLCYTASIRPSMSQIIRALEGFISLGDQIVPVPSSSLPANIYLDLSVLNPSGNNTQNSI